MLGEPYTVIEALFNLVGCAPIAPAAVRPGDPRWHFAEPFFELLGAKMTDALDASSFEKANVIHDMNQPIPESLRGQYDVVFDGGLPGARVRFSNRAT